MAKNKVYTDRTPIDHLIPDDYYVNNQQVNTEAFQATNPIQNENTITQTKKSDPVLEELFSEIESDEKKEQVNETIIEQIKKYLKIVVLIVLIYVIVSSRYTLRFANSYFGNFGLVKTISTDTSVQLVPTTAGSVMQGGMLGIIFVFVKFLLTYVTINT